MLTTSGSFMRIPPNRAESGASAMAMAAGECAQMLHRQGLLTRPPLVHMKPGLALILVTPHRDTLAEALMCFWTIQAGLHSLSCRHPQYIRLSRVLQV